MGDSASGYSPSRASAMSNSSSGGKKSSGRLIATCHKSSAQQPLRQVPSKKGWLVSRKFGRLAASPFTHFLIELAVLEIVRRFSKAKCPLVWSTLQTLQVFCYPPFKWIQRWNPFRALVQGMQALSQPLLVISVANAISECKDIIAGTEDPRQTSESAPPAPALQSQSDLSPLQSTPDDVSSGNEVTQITGDEATEIPSSKTWLLQLHEELQHQGITLPERIDENDLERFYSTANGDVSSCISLVKKTISWRKTYRLLSEEELEVWSNMVFWHGFDAKGRLCLIVRLGLACTTVPLSDRPRFAQAIVSQVEYGVLRLMDHEHSRITVLVDCEGLSPLKFPMKLSLTCSNILQEHFPKRLGCVYVIRLPPVARVIAQTFIQFLKPGTREKLKILGDGYKETLSELIEELPSCLGGPCTCMRCMGDDKRTSPEFYISGTSSYDSIADMANQDIMPELDTIYNTYEHLNVEQVLRKAVVGVLIFWAMIVLLAGVYDPDRT